jgi:hypothetical protein
VSAAERESKRLFRRFVQCTIIEQPCLGGAADLFRSAQAKSPRHPVVGGPSPLKTTSSGSRRRLRATESAQTRFALIQPPAPETPIN